MIDIALTEEQRDCLQELINVAMGQASDKLARFLNTFVHLNVPNIELVNFDSLPADFTENYAQQNLSVVSQGFYGNEGIRGESLLIYKVNTLDDVAKILGYEPGEISDNEQLTDISSILTTTFLNGLAELIENQLSYSAPRVVSSATSSLDDHLKQLSFDWDLALKVDISYMVTDYSFDCDMVLLIPGEAVKNIQLVLERILKEY
ncbi:chemotaxis protein [Catenovulum sp. SM1970]|uniref:chemotaxis protein n=1 Tax=Marinifaba aquimaris TaxID=2741323 RepID=UPI0015719C06|nr:chemotaxis protein [Marinifaba aquimaris]NTS75475.1 chemotaxis protein [Marinifaba aquimaris]